MWTGLGISFHKLATLGFGVQIAMVTIGLVGTATILFYVRTTAARQSLILS